MEASELGAPETLWEAFFELCAVPRPSRHEEAAAAWALERARKAGFEARSDGVGNILVRAPGRKGREGTPRVILQAHLDMVPQKVEGSTHDFLRDPIRPRLDPDDPAWLRATGTTLGADNGIGVAAAFAMLEDPALDRGPIDAIFTVNEESGMTGARGIDPSFIGGDLLVNLDGEFLDEICVGSATGERMSFRLESDAEAVDGTAEVLFAVSVSGLRGGHSGGDIHLGRANAIVELARLVAGPARAGGARLVAMEGGSVPNAIPREARAVFALPAGSVAAFVADFEAAAERLRDRFAAPEPGLRTAVDAVAGPGERPGATGALEAETGARLLDALAAAPDGLRSLMDGMGDVARLSSNIGLVRSAVGADGRMVVDGMLLARGAYDAELDGLCDGIARALESGGCAVERVARTLGWSPDYGSPLLAAAREAWAAALGAEPAARATHGGLECGLLRASRPTLDMISVGPDIRFPHSPDEAVRVESVERFYAALRALLENLARKA